MKYTFLSAAKGVLALWLMTGAAAGQGFPLPRESIEHEQSAEGAYLRGSVKGSAVHTRIQEALAGKDWEGACLALQSLIQTPRDLVIALPAKDGKPPTLVGAHAAALRVLAVAPEPLRQAYEHMYGPGARRLLDMAASHRSVQPLHGVIDHYVATEAGADALTLVADGYFHAKRSSQAARCYALLSDYHPKRAAVDPRVLYQSVVAFRQAGAVQQAAKAWQQLADKIGGGRLHIGESKLTVEQIRGSLETEAPLPTAPLRDWRMFRGNPSRNGRVAPGLPLVSRPKWRRSLLVDAEFDERPKRVEDLQEKAQQALAGHTGAILPGFQPLVLEGQLIYRTYGDGRAIALKDRKVSWGDVRAGDVLWKTSDMDSGLANLLDVDSSLRGFIGKWLEHWLKTGHGHVIYENAMAAAISADLSKFYLVDDLGVPPVPELLHPVGWEWHARHLYVELRRAVMQNSLSAFEYRKLEGKLYWRLGSIYRPDAFSGSHFLGAPLPLDGSLYVLNEKNDGELHLLRVNPKTGQAEDRHLFAITQPHRRYFMDFRRRMSPVHLAAGEGVLVCPTHAGLLLGVDLVSHRLLWAYAYHEEPAPKGVKGRPVSAPPKNFTIHWKAASPIIADGKVVFTAPEEASVHCLRLKDGAPLWKAKNEDDVYLAHLFDDRVLLVGKTSCRALDVNSGKELWKVDTGVPSGLGAASGSVYYLPLRKGSISGRAEVCALDVAKGQVIARVEAKEAPGNLAFHDGLVASQTPLTVTVYPQVKKE